MHSNDRNSAVTIFNAAINAVAGYNATYRAVNSFADFTPDQIIAVGKAASGMCAGALAALGNDCPALLVTKYAHTDQAMWDANNVTVIESAHPVPDQNSLNAGKQMLATVNSMEAGSKLLLLVSGGASALSEALPADVSLEDWQKLTNQMLAAGYNIDQINTRRKETSLIKDGKLLENFTGTDVRVLAISDVEGDDISVIGSGTGSIKRCPSTASVTLIGTNHVAREAAANKATELGYHVIDNKENLYDDVEVLSSYIGQQLINAEPGVYIFGGEPTVKLPENPGNGGRNQALALGIAENIVGRDNILVLVAGTDGSDGPTDAAGGIVDGSTAKDLHAVRDALKRADAGTYLREQDAIFITGPTNTNVMDIVIAILH
ncbi:MAG: glycerate kinase type-2 family protein [Marinomonas sp.]|uniref:glycerate kinase type-2 family protein n=1 Tax=Marinomonas sp. TaxID=1904862 RepID=UPI003F9B9B73